jgi:hypothetical protein
MSFKSESLDGQLLGQGLRAHVIAFFLKNVHSVT